MGLRSRIKRLVGRVVNTEMKSSVSSIEKGAVSLDRKSPNVEAGSVHDHQSKSTGQAEHIETRPEHKPTVEAVSTKETDEKVQQHRIRTKSALLQCAQEMGGTASLGELHDLAERRYFIAHKAFSDLMEEMVSEKLWHYEWGVQEATITDEGVAFLEKHPARKRK